MKTYLSLIALTFLSLSALGQDEKAVSFTTANWSPDSKWISFTRMDITQSKPMRIDADVYVVAADGSGMRRVTGEGGNEFGPVFSKDEKTLLFSSVSNETKVGDIFTANIDGSNVKAWGLRQNRPSVPRYSPNGKWITFNAMLTSDEKDHFPQIYLMKADGTGLKQLTNDGTIAFYDPVWSPDGKRFVYYVERGDNKDQIWSMSSDGAEQKLLTKNIAHNFYPSWTSDGKRVIFTSNRNGKQELFSMSADGPDVKALGVEAFYGRQSPDGKKLLYIAGQFPHMHLYVANADGSSPIKITQ